MPVYRNIYRPGGDDVALADGGTGVSLADPNADRIMFWDDSGGGVTWLTAGTGLTITGTSIAASGGTGSIELGYGEFTAETALGTNTVICQTGAISLGGSTPVMIEFNAPKWAGNSTIQLKVFYVKDGGAATEVGIAAQGLASGSYTDQGNAFFRWPLRGASTPASGSYVFSIRGSSTAGSVYAGSGGTGALLPGYILVTSLPTS